VDPVRRIAIFVLRIICICWAEYSSDLDHKLISYGKVRGNTEKWGEKCLHTIENVWRNIPKCPWYIFTGC
jgi:hypothetical protein